MVTRVSEFVSTMNELTERSGAAGNQVEENIGKFHNVTTRVLGDLAQLATQFETHGRGLAEAVDLIDRSNRRTEDTLSERRVALDSVLSTLDIRTDDLEQRLKRFAGLLDESLDAAASRARDIARVVSEASMGSTQAISEQFDLVRSTAEEERKHTVQTMRGIYEEATGDANTMLRQTTERFSEIVHGMKHMAAEMQRELEATRGELRRGILELPQETAESAAQMRRVIVDQIEALAELNRIVARHGRGLDAAEPARRTSTGRDESILAGAGARQETARSSMSPDYGPPSGPPRRAEAPSLSPAAGNGRSGWLTDLLSRASREEGDIAPELPREPLREMPRETARGDERTARHSIESLDSLSVDIARMIDHDAAAELWDKYKRGERNVFTRRLYTLQGQKAFDEIRKKYRADREFKQTVDRYIAEFERLLDEVSRDDRGQVVARTYLTSETGKVYTMLAHAAGRFE
jgi:archaellum component FlaC